MIGVRVEVDGAEDVVRAFNSLGYKSRDLSGAWTRIGGAVKSDAIALTPVLSGRLAATIRQSKAKTRSTVSAGGYGVLYAGVQNYGGYQGITPKYFLNTANDQNESNAANELLSEMNRLIASVGMNS